MPDIPCEYNQNPRKVIHEIVAFRYSDEQSIMLIGEAEKGLDDVVAGRSRSAQPFLRAVRQRRAARSR